MTRRFAAVALAVALASCSDGDGDPDAFCARLEHDQARYETVFDGFTDLTDREDAHQRFARAEEDLVELRDLAPGELRDSLDVMLETVRDLDAAIDEVDPGDPASANAAVAEVRERSEEIGEAGAELETYRQTRCQAPPTSD